MNRLFKHRLSTHLVHMSKYLKYVFNDFFVIALLFFVGGLGFAYSNFLKTLRPDDDVIPILMGIVMLISIQFGRLATLTQSPDYVFLLPRDWAMKSYLRQALKYSCVNAGVIQTVVWFGLLPMLKIQFRLGWPGLLSWLAMMLLLKFSWLLSDVNLEFQDKNWFDSRWVSRLIVPIISISLGLIIAPGLGVIIAVAEVIGQVISYQRQTGPVDWLRLIRNENHRMHDIYTVFNMFVDVPNFGSAISRRRYLTPLLKLIRKRRSNSYLYLYWHGFVRDKEFSNLYFRLTIIGLIILIFINNAILALIMGLVFIYLIVFQIIPFYFHFEDNAFVHIYPLRGINQLKSFQKMLWSLMTIVELLFMIGSVINGQSIVNEGLLVILMTFESCGMINVYLPKQVKKNN